MGPMNAREIAERVLEAGLTGDHGLIAEMMAPDGVIEWPYHPEGVAGLLRGHDQIRAFMAASGNLIDFEEYRDVVIHDTTDPDVAIVEYSAYGRVTATGAPFEQRVIAVLRVRDGLIAHYRDYVNPLPLMAVL